VLGALAYIVERHNAWAAEKPAERGQYMVSLKDFESAEGTREAVQKIQAAKSAP
jgi:hypothetical protein